MDYFIVLNTILTFLICLTKANDSYEVCEDNEDCVDLKEDINDSRAKDANDLIEGTGDPYANGRLRYCGLNKVCCEEKPIVNQSISEKSKFITVCKNNKNNCLIISMNFFYSLHAVAIYF